VAFEPAVITSLLAVAVMLLLAGWLLWLDFESRVNRAFALFLFLRSGLALFNTLFVLVPDALPFWTGIRGYFSVATPVALLFFAFTYFGPSRGWVRIARGACFGLALLAETLYAWNHCLEVCTTAAGIRFGPLSLISYSLPIGYAGTALLLARRASVANASSQRRAGWIVSVAFLANGLVDGTLAIPGWVDVVGRGLYAIYVPSFFVPAALTLYVLAVPVALLALLSLLRSVAGQANMAAYRARALTVAMLAILSGAFVGWDPMLPSALENARYFVIGAWRLLLPSLVAYALVRHRLFDLDVKIRLGIRVGSVAGFFVTVFFVSTELAQTVLGEVTQSPVIGIILAGSLVFFLHPLQKGAERLSQRAIPGSAPLSQLSHGERLQLFLDQASVAWSDGALTRRERIMLSQLQTRLGLSVAEASAAEAKAMMASPAPGARRASRKRSG
jgi:hypothetical protein